MLSREDNDRLTQTGPGHAVRRSLRAYWQPAALVSELRDERPVKPVRLLGEDLVLFRKPDGGYGLIGRYCAHRGVDLAYGRLEDGGLRCLYHGWLYGPDGRCLEQPAEPAHSRFHEKIRHIELPVRASATASSSPTSAAATRRRSPTTTASSRPTSTRSPSRGSGSATGSRASRAASTPATSRSCTASSTRTRARRTASSSPRRSRAPDKTLSELVGANPRPDIEVEPTEYGLRVFAIRELDEEIRHVRITNLHVPQRLRRAVRQHEGVRPVARPDRRREPLLVHDPLRLRRGRPTRRRCCAQRLDALHAARLPAGPQPRQQLGLRPARAAAS